MQPQRAPRSTRRDPGDSRVTALPPLRTETQTREPTLPRCRRPPAPAHRTAPERNSAIRRHTVNPDAHGPIAGTMSLLRSFATLRGLPADQWAPRHRAICALLLAHLPGLAVLGAIEGFG